MTIRALQTPCTVASLPLFLVLLLMLFVGLASCSSGEANQPAGALLERAAANGLLAGEGFRRAQWFVTDWLEHADPETGLIPRNLHDSRDLWNAQDAAADNYPFMVLTTFFTDRDLFEGRMHQMLRTERQLTSRLGPLPDSYSFSKKTFMEEEPDLSGIIFGASEYVKDGLLPMTEWLGSSPWSERMIEIIDGIWEVAPVETPYGKIPSESHEINGEMLQTLSRIYWMTGEDKYLEWAMRLGDYYLLGNHHPTRDSERLRLRDHGCEIVSGLTELYATLHFTLPEKKATYREPIYTMLDRILEVGRNEHHLFYNVVNPRTGEVIDDRPADTFGYTYNAYYTVYLIDSIQRYQKAVLEALESLKENYYNFSWEGGSADGDADAIEGALNLYNREPLPSVAEWIDREIKFMWSKQDSNRRDRDLHQWDGSGIIEGWHGDGNFARTTLYYCLWKTQGLHVRPWREDVVVGAVTDQTNRLIISLTTNDNWDGTLHFDHRRHAEQMQLPLDWPRINQFPEWFTIDPDAHYIVHDLSNNTQATYTGQQLLDGLNLSVRPETTKHLMVTVASSPS